MSISTGLRISLTGLDVQCTKIKYKLTVNSVLYQNGVIIDRPSNNKLVITDYNAGTKFIADDVVKVEIAQGLSFQEISGNSQSGEVTYSSYGSTGDITINYSAPSQPTAPSLSNESDIIDTINIHLQAKFTLTSVDSTADKVRYTISVTSAVTGLTYISQQYTVSITPNTNFQIYEGALTGSPSDKSILVNRIPTIDTTFLGRGDAVLLTVAVGIPLGDGTSYFSNNATNTATLTVPAPGGSPATPGLTLLQYGY